MMINFPGLSRLKTKKIVFEEIFSGRDAITLEQLQEMSCRRRFIHDSLNHITSTTTAAASTSLTKRCVQVEVQKLEEYLPLLENFTYHVHLMGDNARVVGWTSKLNIRWSSNLSSSSCLFQSKYFQIDDIYFELGMVLFLYGQLLRDKALDLLQTDLVQSATLLRKAAGVYDHLAIQILPRLLQTKKSSERPPESLSCVSSVMSLICLAEAQAVSARKAEEKGNAPSLLSKLHYGCKVFLDEAQAVLHSSIKECKDTILSSKFKDFVTTYGALHELKSYMYLGEALKADDKIGEAIGVVRQVLSNSDKHMIMTTLPKEESWRSVYKQVIEDLRKQLKKNEYENDFLEQVKVPNKYDLPSPQCVKIVKSIAYQVQRTEKILVFKL